MSQSIIVKIDFTCSGDKEHIFIPETLCKEWNLFSEGSISVQLGHNTIFTKILYTSSMKQEILIPRALKKELKLPFSCQLYAMFSPGTLRVGPLIGILVNSVYKSGGYINSLLLSQSRNNVLCFLFTPEDTDWSAKVVKASFLINSSKDKTIRKTFYVPFPDVIYNCLYRKTEKSTSIVNFMRELRFHTHARIFNNFFLNKKLFHKNLIRYPEISQYVPETCLAPSLKQLKELLIRCHIIYLKPLNGALGIGIFKVFYQEDSKYLCQYRKDKLTVSEEYRSLNELLNAHFKYDKLSIYLAQQAITLASFDSYKFDFRIHLNKSIDNMWVVSAIAANVTVKDNPTTHGGWIKPCQYVLEQAFGEKSHLIEEKLKDIAIKSAILLEYKLKLDIGELGFDAGVDPNGHIWLFEANSKPGRHIFKHKSLKSENLNSINYLLGYCTYLAGFN